MGQLIFFDDGHRYEVDGVPVPSVSEITRFIDKEIYTDAPQSAMETAAKRGTAVHKATEVLDKYRTVECDDETAPYVKAYVAYLKEHNPEYDHIEWAVCHPDKLYAGTLDRVFTATDGKIHILDIKTTANIDRPHKIAYSAKLTLYQMAIEHQYPEAEFVLEILQLKKDETFKLITLEQNRPLAESCIILHKALEKQPRKRKESNNG